MTNFLYLAVLGFSAGALGAFTGVGAGFVVTPGLSFLGIPTPIAVGTSLAVLFLRNLPALHRHAGLRTIRWARGIILGLTASLATIAGKEFLRRVELAGAGEAWLDWSYLVLMIAVAAYTGRDSLRATVIRTAPEKTGLFPYVPLGLGIGFVSGSLGVGAGFLLVPILIYGIGMPVKVSVGTSILAITISTAWASWSFLADGLVLVREAVLLIITGSAGAFLAAGRLKTSGDRRVKTCLAVATASVALATMLRRAGQPLAAPLLLLGGVIVVAFVIFSPRRSA